MSAGRADAPGKDASDADAPAPDASGADAGDGEPGEAPRQRVERAKRGRRARLTPAPGSDPSPEEKVPGDDGRRGSRGPASPDDERITRERPPHW
ncbi:hypothetical protein [Agromyces archimandritae]|uniref:Uncharacterized protein n=1 Tax=Agromyces archimandritae TaxID=2781962 RepID=A0A975FQE4_9MICO|nr:hypothetical protein [Agromyces archimandritae]QTX06369.1 hypothetical protein G127AT_12030 [Agromyces archimandritae]